MRGSREFKKPRIQKAHGTETKEFGSVDHAFCRLELPHLPNSRLLEFLASRLLPNGFFPYQRGIPIFPAVLVVSVLCQARGCICQSRREHRGLRASSSPSGRISHGGHGSDSRAIRGWRLATILGFARHAGSTVRKQHELLQIRFLFQIEGNPIPAEYVAAPGEHHQLHFWIAAFKL